MKYMCLNGGKCRNLEPIKVDTLEESVAVCPECQHKNKPIEYLFRCVGFWMPGELNDQGDGQKQSDVIDVLNWIGLVGVREKQRQHRKQHNFMFDDVSGVLRHKYNNSDLRFAITAWVGTKHFGDALRSAGYEVHENGFLLKEH